MSERFIKFIPSEEASYLRSHHPFAFLLLNLIAERARRVYGSPDGLEIGEAHIGDHKSIGATRGQYRHALKVLLSRKYLTIIENCRNRKKATTGTTTVGTKVKLLNSMIWDINIMDNNHRNNHPTTTERPPNDHEQECKESKEQDMSVLSCPVEPPVADSSVWEKIEKADFQGKKFFLCRDDVTTACIQHRLDWSLQEIHQVWQILKKHSEPLRDWVKFCDGTIKNLRIKKSIKTLGEKQCQKMKEKLPYNSKREKFDSNPTSENIKSSTLAKDMQQQPFLNCKFLKGRPLRS